MHDQAAVHVVKSRGDPKHESVVLRCDVERNAAEEVARAGWLLYCGTCGFYTCRQESVTMTHSDGYGRHTLNKSKRARLLTMRVR